MVAGGFLTILATAVPAGGLDPPPFVSHRKWLGDIRRPDPALVERSVRNRLPKGTPAKQIDERDRDKAPEAVMVRKWIEIDPKARGGQITTQIHEDRTLAKYFPHTTFYRLTARRGSRTHTGYGGVSLGQPLHLPEDINLLLILENRRVNRHNVRLLSELIVRLADPEGAETLHVLSHVVDRDEVTQEMQGVVLETWSYDRNLKKRWTISLRGPYFYALEERILSYRPKIFEEYGQQDIDMFREDELPGPESQELYRVFWRSPAERNAMQAVRDRWRESRRRP